MTDSVEDLEEAVAVFTSVRPRLFGIAYRMLASATEAEDLVQEVWLRWQTCDRATVLNPAAFLATTTTRLAINALQSARVRRETYIGPWLPKPVDTSADPYLGWLPRPHARLPLPRCVRTVVRGEAVSRTASKGS